MIITNVTEVAGMTNKILIAGLLIFLVGGSVFAADLSVDYQVDTSGKTKTSYFSFKGPIRYMEADKDHYDAVSGASVKKSTEMFQPYRYDVKGENALADGLRGLFLFGVAGSEQAKIDNLNAKEVNGVITIQYAHRGTAYRIITDKNGNITLPDGMFEKRAIGFIPQGKPQVISKDFSSNGAADRVDWNKVWNSSVPGGKEVAPGSGKKNRENS